MPLHYKYNHIQISHCVVSFCYPADVYSLYTFFFWFFTLTSIWTRRECRGTHVRECRNLKQTNKKNKKKVYHTSNGLREEKNEQENAAQRKTGERESVLVYGNWRVCVFVSISFIFILILHFCRILLIIKWKHFECIHTHTHTQAVYNSLLQTFSHSLSLYPSVTMALWL